MSQEAACTSNFVFKTPNNDALRHLPIGIIIAIQEVLGAISNGTITEDSCLDGNPGEKTGLSLQSCKTNYVRATKGVSKPGKLGMDISSRIRQKITDSGPYSFSAISRLRSNVKT